MPTELTPRKAIIKLNRIRTDKGERPPEIDMAIERPPEIDMAIRAINLNMVRRIPIENSKSEWCCPSCNYPIDFDFCAHCGQALDWTN